MREHQQPVPVVDGLCQKFLEGLELGGRRSHLLGRLEQPGIAAELSEAEQLGECRELEPPLVRTAGLKVDELAFAALLEFPVSRGLLIGKVAPDDLLNARG